MPDEECRRQDDRYRDELLDTETIDKQESQQSPRNAPHRERQASSRIHREYGDSDSEDTQRRPSRESQMEFASILLFVLGSVLYVLCAVDDYQWSQTLLELPEWLREVDDDGPWMKYRLEEQYGHVLEHRRIRGRRGLTMRQRQQVWGTSTKRGYNHELFKYIERYSNSQAQTPEELYYHLDWVDLPPEIQDAYSVLGYNQNAWDKGLEVEADNTDWADLSPEQVNAALFIGYTEMLWCGLEDLEQSTREPTWLPSTMPTQRPISSTKSPSIEPSRSAVPSFAPSNILSSSPSTSSQPTETMSPSSLPSTEPSLQPSISNQPTISFAPSINQILAPLTPLPTMKFWLLGVPYSPPSTKPSAAPSYHPAAFNSTSPSNYPSSSFSIEPSFSPSNVPLFVSTYGPSSTPVSEQIVVFYVSYFDDSKQPN